MFEGRAIAAVVGAAMSGEWPGDERVEELAYLGCLDRFAGAIGKGYEDSVIEIKETFVAATDYRYPFMEGE